jgi:hypothetical protein
VIATGFGCATAEPTSSGTADVPAELASVDAVSGGAMEGISDEFII